MKKQTFISYAGTDRFPAPILKEVFEKFTVFRSVERIGNYMEFENENVPAELSKKPWNKYAQ